MAVSKELKELITKEADALYDCLNEKAQEIDSYDFGHPMANRQTQPIIDCLTQYAEIWQAAEAKAERYEKALKLIEQMSDPGDYWKAICDMKAIATEALTPKTSSDECRL